MRGAGDIVGRCGPGDGSPATSRVQQMLALQVKRPRSVGSAARKGTSGRDQRLHPFLSQGSSGASSTAYQKLRPSSFQSASGPQTGLPPRTCVLRPHTGSAATSATAEPARSRPTRRPRPGRPVPARPGAPFLAVPRRRPRPARPDSPSSKRSSGAPGAAMARRSRGRSTAVARAAGPAGGRVHRFERPGSCGAGTEGTLRPAAPVT